MTSNRRQASRRMIATISIVDETGQICLDGLFWATLSGYSRSFRREEE